MADDYNLELLEKRLIDSLNWRNEFQPLSAAFEETFDKELNELGVTNFLQFKFKNYYMEFVW